MIWIKNIPQIKNLPFLLKEKPLLPCDFWVVSGTWRNVITCAYLFGVCCRSRGLNSNTFLDSIDCFVRLRKNSLPVSVVFVLSSSLLLNHLNRRGKNLGPQITVRTSNSVSNKCLVCLWRVREQFVFTRNSLKFLRHVESKRVNLKSSLCRKHVFSLTTKPLKNTGDKSRNILATKTALDFSASYRNYGFYQGEMQ